MTDKIHVLSEDVAALIAAGEVVERPQSVVKELVENAVDAGATKINVEIEQSGVKLIRITDNGSGMSRNDAMLSFVKHATSKISTKDDLFAIQTLGFRGEALASISAVSHFEIVTKTRDNVIATKITVNGGVQSESEDTAAPDGTSISVRDLFYNTPARLKFLKSDQTETGLIVTLIERLALSHPEISFRLTVNGRETLFTTGNGKLSDVIYSIFGRDFSDMMIDVNYSEDIIINGYIGKPLYSKPNRNFQVFFVNGRLVRSKTLQNTLEAAYKNSMLISRYPVCVLFLEIDCSDIDINVHPSKQEIKFSDESVVKNALTKAINKALIGDTGIVPIIKEPVIEVKPVVTPQQEVKKYDDWEIISNKMNVADIIQNVVDNTDQQPYAEISENDTVTITYPVYEQKHLEPIEIKPITVEKPPEIVKPVYEQEKLENKINWKLVGEAFNSFAIIQKGDDILFIDKHALHERINFEHLKTRKPQIQTLLTPLTISLGGEEYSKIIENVKTLETLGFEIEDFGIGTVLVRKIPQILSVTDVEYLLNKFASGVCSAKSTYDEFLYDIACKASIKSGMETSEYELRKLVDEYLNREAELKYCPHGRPVCFSLSKTALEKQFKRIV